MTTKTLDPITLEILATARQDHRFDKASRGFGFYVSQAFVVRENAEDADEAQFFTVAEELVNMGFLC